MTICQHLRCTSCASIVAGLIAQQLRTVPEVARTAVLVQALRLAKMPTLEARAIDEMMD